MEIFAGARLEVSQRARFLAIVSAFEPLAEQRSLGQDVDQFVESCLFQLSERSSIADAARTSLGGRLQQLRTESIRQAIIRTIRESLPQRTRLLKVVDDAYAVRSQIVHSGRPSNLDLDLERLGNDVGDILREIYASRVGRTLAAPTKSG